MTEIEAIGLPETAEKHDCSYFLSFYGWKEKSDTGWLKIIEELAKEFSLKLAEGTGNSDEMNSHGSYSRIKKRLKLITEKGHERYSIRVKSQQLNESPRIAFYVAQSEFLGRFGGVVLSFPSISSQEFEEITLRHLSKKVHCFYGGFCVFESSFDPGLYLSAISQAQVEYSYAEMEAYRNRLTAWRDNIEKDMSLYSQGYFREIYPINYVYPTHLNIKVDDKILTELINENGTLRTLDSFDNMKRFTINSDCLNNVRDSMETSGRVLSANMSQYAL